MQLVERPMPEIKEPNQVLVKVHAAGICGSDVHVYHGSNPYAKYPVVLGHEGSGEVIAVGEGVTDLKPGASVVFEPITYCGKCYACRCGHHNVCRELKVLGCIVDGIFQEYVVMPRSQVYEYDASKMTYQQAALCEPFTIGLQANWRGDVRPGDVVLVHGGGPIGLIVANIAKSRGATVIVSEPNESRLAMAKDFGADYSINPMKEDLDAFINKLTDGEGVNVIFEAAGIPALLAHATSQLSPAGRLVAMTFGKEPIPVNFKEINAKELTILGTRHQYQKFPEVVKILPDHLKEVDEITTHVFKAEDKSDSAVYKSRTDPTQYIVVVNFDGSEPKEESIEHDEIIYDRTDRVVFDMESVPAYVRDRLAAATLKLVSGIKSQVGGIEQMKVQTEARKARKF